MNFLQLCQRLRQETGISDSGPSNVTGQTGDMKRIVDWVNESWVRLQGMRPNWNWMWKLGEVEIPAGVKIIPMNDRLIPDTVYVDGTPIRVIAYPEFREITRQNSVPNVVAYRPDGALAIGAASANARLMSYEAYREPQRFTQGINAPFMPEPYHMIIVWAALMEYAIYDEAPELIQKARLNYEQLLAELTANTLPTIEMPGPLA